MRVARPTRGVRGEASRAEGPLRRTAPTQPARRRRSIPLSPPLPPRPRQARERGAQARKSRRGGPGAQPPHTMPPPGLRASSAERAGGGGAGGGGLTAPSRGGEAQRRSPARQRVHAGCRAGPSKTSPGLWCCSPCGAAAIKLHWKAAGPRVPPLSPPPPCPAAHRTARRGRTHTDPRRFCASSPKRWARRGEGPYSHSRAAPTAAAPRPGQRWRDGRRISRRRSRCADAGARSSPSACVVLARGDPPCMPPVPLFDSPRSPPPGRRFCATASSWRTTRSSAPCCRRAGEYTGFPPFFGGAVASLASRRRHAAGRFEA